MFIISFKKVCMLPHSLDCHLKLLLWVVSVQILVYTVEFDNSVSNHMCLEQHTRSPQKIRFLSVMNGFPTSLVPVYDIKDSLI